jgi:hypothetical protein
MRYTRTHTHRPKLNTPRALRMRMTPFSNVDDLLA